MDGDTVTIAVIVASIVVPLALFGMIGWTHFRGQRGSNERFERYVVERQLQLLPGSTPQSFVAVGAAGGVPYTLETVVLVTRGADPTTSTHVVHLQVSAQAPPGTADGVVYNRRCHWAADDLLGYAPLATGHADFDRRFRVLTPGGDGVAWLDPSMRSRLLALREHNSLRLHQLTVSDGAVRVRFTDVLTDHALLDRAIELVTGRAPQPVPQG
jgi:hypothetical protein